MARKSIGILDDDYILWIKELSSRYRRSQVKAATKVNAEMLHFYWELGRDITKRDAENKYGNNFYGMLSADLRKVLPGVDGFSPSNIRYSKRFYQLYSSILENLQQVDEKLLGEGSQQVAGQLTEAQELPKVQQAVGQLQKQNLQQITANLGRENLPQLVEDFQKAIFPQAVEKLFCVPWGHHRLIIDKCSDDPQRALFFIQSTIENGWSRSMLLNFISTDLYERQGKALTNFSRTLPLETSELAQELTKDPYNFAFTGITGHYNERLLKDNLLKNITSFLVELGTGFAYVGKEYRIQVGKREHFIDLLFYNLNLSCYIVIEVKIGKFEFEDIGQLGGYMVACNHQLKKEGRDNPTIGLLICKEKDKVQAQYALESSTQPIAISEYDLEKFYPEKIEGTIPTIEEIEKGLETH